MSLSFNVDAGPLSQIGLELASLTTAVQLATGAYGWFKAKERSRSLNQLLSSSGAELVATSAFNLTTYKSVRARHGPMQGALVKEGIVQSVSLPKANTSVPDHAGVACLRALTTVLLCLCSIEVTVTILENVIPACLLQYHQEGTSFEFDGPLLAGLKQWVTAIAIEEDTNPLRDSILKAALEKQCKLTKVALSELWALDMTNVSDAALMIGLIRWTLLPLHSRPMDKYPTRSLNVWTIAFILGELGFIVHASASVVYDPESYSELLSRISVFPSQPSVFLVLAKSGETDPMAVQKEIITGDDLPRPQPTLLRGVPWLAFRHLREPVNGYGAEYLAEIWSYSFQEARSSFRRLKVDQMQVKVIIDGHNDERPFMPQSHNKLISGFSPHLLRLCASAMCRFVPPDSCAKEWNPHEIKERLEVLCTEEDARDQTTENCYTMIAIVLGSIYGLCSGACMQGNSSLTEDSEIAFSAETIYDRRAGSLKRWAGNVGHALNSSLDFTIWCDLILELFLAISTGDSTPQGKPSRYAEGQNPHGRRLILGAQGNGFAAVSETIVLPTIRTSALGYFHISRGQILNFPLTDEGFIQASTYLTPSVSLTLDPDPKIDKLFCFEDADFSSQMRLDVEPCWEEDPRSIVFRLRKSGVVFAPLNIFLIINRLAHYTALQRACRCAAPSLEPVSVPLNSQWQHVWLHQLRRKYYQERSTSRARIDDCRALVDASQSELATAYALGIIDSRYMHVVTSCLKCATNAELESVVVIPHRTILEEDN